MKVVKMILAVLVSLAFAAAMFYCFVAGAPMQTGSVLIYVVMSALFSLLISAILVFCFFYIDYLQRKLEELPADETVRIISEKSR